MIRSKVRLLLALVMLLIGVDYSARVWAFIETGGLHWLTNRLPLLLYWVLAIYLFLSSITDYRPAEEEE